MKSILLLSVLAFPILASMAGFDNTLPGHNQRNSSILYSKGLRNLAELTYSGPVPETFDARERWVHCPNIGNIPDQGCCSSSYTIAPTAVISDRTCIASDGNIQKLFSAHDPLVCCKDCAIYPPDRCRGGDSVAVWNYWMEVGIASGGDFNSSLGCLPYPFRTNCVKQNCPVLCVPGYSRSTVSTDRDRGARVYGVGPDVNAIQVEILLKGPVETTIHSYLDFVNFKGASVYRHGAGSYVGEQHLKIIGWGTQDGTDYWLAINSFGRNWGDHGVVKFLRGEDHLGVESHMRAGVPGI